MRESLVEIYLHLVWATWDRQPCISADIESDVYSAILDKCRTYRCTVLAIGGIEDHVHLLVRTSHQMDISAMVRDAKGSSSHLVTTVLKPNDFFRWQGGYGAFSIDPRSVGRVTEYIQNQKTHHAENTTPAYLEQFLTEESTRPISNKRGAPSLTKNPTKVGLRSLEVADLPADS
jgi:putative transposase